jgi:hypothetical protein
MKFKLLLLVIGLIPAIVMAQAKPANQLAVEKPIAVNPLERMNHPNVQDKLQVVKAEVTEVVEAYRNNTTHVPPPSEDTQTDTVIFNVNNIQHNITHGYQPIIKP